MLSRRYHHTPILMARGVARLLGSRRREGRHGVIVLNERYLHRVLASSIDHDHMVGSTGFFHMGAVAQPPMHETALGLFRVIPTVGVSSIMTGDGQREPPASMSGEVNCHGASGSTPPWETAVSAAAGG